MQVYLARDRWEGRGMKAEIMKTGIWYETVGESGPRVALLHGWGCDHRTMGPVAEALKDRCRLLLIDFPGHGESDEPAEPWGVHEYADQLMTLMEQLDFLPCSVIAHSFGCRVAAAMAAAHPDRFEKLVFTGAAGIRKPDTPEAAAKREKYQRMKRRAGMIRKIPGLSAVGAEMEKRIREKFGSRDYNALDENMKATFVRIVNEDLTPLYPRIQQPTLLLWGDRDTETPMWMGEKMAEMIPDAGLVKLEGGSHFAYLEQAARFHVIVRHFLTEE